MSSWKDNKITSFGHQMIAKMQAGIPVEFTEMVVGDGLHGEGQGDETILSPKQSFGIQRIEWVEDNTVLIYGILSNEQLEQGFFIRELAVKAKADDDGAEGIYCISYTEDNKADFFPHYSGTELTIRFQLHIATGSTENVTASIRNMHKAYEIEYDNNLTGIDAANVQDVLDAIYIKNIKDGEGEGSTEAGTGTVASGKNAFAEGRGTEAIGDYAHAEGEGAIALGKCSHAEGCDTKTYIEDEAGNKTAGKYAHAEGWGTVASNVASHAEGIETISSGADSHAEGHFTVASGSGSHAEGFKSQATGHYSHAENHMTKAIGKHAHAEGNATAAEGDNSHAEGLETVASSLQAHAEGYKSKASGGTSHAEGYQTKASGAAAHAEGRETEASGDISHAEGYKSKASDGTSHAEGHTTEASGNISHAEGYQSKASGGISHAEGYQTKASGGSSHAEGRETEASGEYAHAEGLKTIASGPRAHAEGLETEAKSMNSHAAGWGTIAASYHQTAVGRNNKESAEESGDLFVVGCGLTENTRDNAFRVDIYGTAYYKKSATNGADYAEFFEWEDGNPHAEDRAGHFVTLSGDKIKVAKSAGEYILGIVSKTPSVVGNSYADTWQGMYLTDEWGQPVYEEVNRAAVTETIRHEPEQDAEGNMIAEGYEETIEIVPAYTEKVQKLNPDYDPSQDYISRENRQEWGIVGLLGQILVKDDGSCEVNGYCMPNEDGIATSTTRGYRVLKRINSHMVQVLFR